MTVVFDSEKFRAIRKERKYTQAKLAEAADTSIRYLRDMEKGRKTNPSAAIVCRLCAVLCVPMECVMSEEEGMV